MIFLLIFIVGSVHMNGDDFASFTASVVSRALNALQYNDDLPSLLMHQERLGTLRRMFLTTVGDNDEQTDFPEMDHLQQIIHDLNSKIETVDDDTKIPVFLPVDMLHSGHRGRPQFVFSVPLLTFLRKQFISWNGIGEMFGVHVNTIKRFRERVGFDDPLVKVDSQVLSDAELDATLTEIQREQPYTGQTFIMGALKSLGIFVTRERLRASLRRIDPGGVLDRWATFIPRRKYSVRYNAL
jgi:hypothetical protein